VSFIRARLKLNPPYDPAEDDQHRSAISIYGNGSHQSCRQRTARRWRPLKKTQRGSPTASGPKRNGFFCVSEPGKCGYSTRGRYFPERDGVTTRSVEPFRPGPSLIVVKALSESISGRFLVSSIDRRLCLRDLPRFPARETGKEKKIVVIWRLVGSFSGKKKTLRSEDGLVLWARTDGGHWEIHYLATSDPRFVFHCLGDRRRRYVT